MSKLKRNGAAGKINLMRTLFNFILFVFPFWAGSLWAQVPIQNEVRQIVMFSFAPGKSAEAIDLFRNQAIPLYDKNSAMLSFRGFREVESPIPLDLMVISAFRGMAGMDHSNAELSADAKAAGSSLGSLYGNIAALSTNHTDQFVEMIVPLGTGDASSRNLSAFIWYRIAPGHSTEFERLLETSIVPWETDAKIPSSSGRFLVSDGWHYLRILGFSSLGDYQHYWARVRLQAGFEQMEKLMTRRREIITANLNEFSVR